METLNDYTSPPLCKRGVRGGFAFFCQYSFSFKSPCPLLQELHLENYWVPRIK